MLDMFKLIASLLIICSAGLAGLRAASAYSLRTRQLRTLQEALQLLDTEIMYGATPLPAALSKVAAAAGEVVGDVFSEAGAILGKAAALLPGRPGTWPSSGTSAGRPLPGKTGRSCAHLERPWVLRTVQSSINISLSLRSTCARRKRKPNATARRTNGSGNTGVSWWASALFYYCCRT